MDFIPVNEPLLDGNEKKYLMHCIDTGWISSEGPFVKELEEKFAKRTGRKYGIAVCNGTAALEAFRSKNNSLLRESGKDAEILRGVYGE